MGTSKIWPDNNVFASVRGRGFKHLAAELSEFNHGLPYARFFGGAALVSSELFQAVNGYSNGYWGWGGEDDDLALRIMRQVATLPATFPAKDIH